MATPDQEVESAEEGLLREQPPVLNEIRRFREMYAGRRTVSDQMFAAAETLVRTGLAEREAAHRQELRDLRREHERALVAKDRLHKIEVDSLKWAADYAAKRHDADAATLTVFREQNTNLREQMESIEGGTRVIIKSPRVLISNGPNGVVRPWQLAEVESLTYRLRMCGGGDTTEMDFKHGQVETFVPYPDMALFPAQQLPKAPKEWPFTVPMAVVAPVVALMFFAVLFAIYRLVVW